MGKIPRISIKRNNVDCHWIVVCERRGILRRFVSERQAVAFKGVAECVAKSAAGIERKGKANEGKDEGSSGGVGRKGR
jgi:hypothetical protein